MVEPTEDRLVASEPQNEDAALESGLRPRRLPDYVGQGRVIDNLKVSIQAAIQRNEPLDHVLLHGPPGLGKTTLAFIIAAEMGVSVRVTAGPSFTRAGDLAQMLTQIL